MREVHGPLVPAARPSLDAEGELQRRAEGGREFLGFVLGPENYALPLSSIREIVRMPRVTPVPRAPRDVLGILSVRGQVITLIDLRSRMSLPEAPASRHSRVLLVDHGRETLGLLVDDVLQVYRLKEDEVEMSTVLGSDASSYIVGIARPKQARLGRGAQESALGENDILILLDTMTLLKQYGGG